MAKQLTWKQFKEEVDRSMKDQGIAEDAVIHYIDTSYPEEVLVTFDEVHGLAIG